ncbi:glycosyltransferase [Marichromatium sp. AB31]|nr:glycosyltransferase [Marichromatium sp. AB31]
MPSPTGSCGSMTEPSGADCPARIVLIGPLPPPAGGMANQTRQLAELLRAEGLAVELVQVNAPYRPAWAGRLPVVRALFRLLPYLWRLWRAMGGGGVVHLMANSGWSWHLFAAPALLIARVRGLPAVINYRGGEAQIFLRAQARWVVPLMRRAAAIAVPSGYLRAVFAPYGLEAEVVPNIVDLERFAARAAAARHPEVPHLVVTRNLEAIYDNTTALRAFARIRARWPAARLTIAGTGPEAAALAAEARALGIAESVTFSGRLERAAMAALYAEADLMLNPSRVDNTPNSVLEAWASGVAVVSTRVGGLPYLVEDGVDAVLVAPGDPEALAEAACALLDDPPRRAALVAAGRRAAERFSWPAVRPLWLALYRRIAGGEGCGE